MAKQIIVLETTPSNGGQISVRAAFWFPVTAGQEVPKPAFVSAWKTNAVPGPSTQETADLQNGTVVEEVVSPIFPDNYTAAQIKAALVTFYQRRAAYLATLPFQGKYYGVSFDGTAWSA